MKELDLDVFNCVRKVMIHGQQFYTIFFGEYETVNLRTPYRILSLMLNRIFNQTNGNFYKISWVPIIYFVATQGTILKWANIISNNLSSCISTVLGGVSEKKSEFYMSSFMIYCILCIQ